MAVTAYRLAKRTDKDAFSLPKRTAKNDLSEKLETINIDRFIYRLAREQAATIENTGHFRQVKDKLGKLLKKTSEILKHWYQYFKEIAVVEFVSNAIPMYGPVLCVTYNGVATAIYKMKDCKVVSTNDIPILGNMLARWNHLAGAWSISITVQM